MEGGVAVGGEYACVCLSKSSYLKKRVLIHVIFLKIVKFSLRISAISKNRHANCVHSYPNH